MEPDASVHALIWPEQTYISHSCSGTPYWVDSPCSGAISYASRHKLPDFGAVMGLISLGWNKFQPQCQHKRTWLKVTSSLVHVETMFGTLSLAVKELGKISGLNKEALFYSSFFPFLQTGSVFIASEGGFLHRPAEQIKTDGGTGVQWLTKGFWVWFQLRPFLVLPPGNPFSSHSPELCTVVRLEATNCP